MVLSQFHSQSATRQIKQVSYDTLVTSLFRYQTFCKRFCKPGVLQSSHHKKAKMQVVMSYLCLTTGIKTQSVQLHRLQKQLSERDVLKATTDDVHSGHLCGYTVNLAIDNNWPKITQ